jgi:beta-galactosidase
VRELAARYGAHPAVEAWHINNEYGCHVHESFDEESVAAFRLWLEQRYGGIDELNRAWGTAFWSQGYASFDEVDAPRAAPTFRNPTQQLDWRRFGNHALLELFRMEKRVLAELSPGVPVTTNFMGMFAPLDYWQWAPEVDFVSDDCYPDPADAAWQPRAAAVRDLMRSLGGGKPWLLMEQSPSAVNWRERNAPKPAGMNRMHALQSVARGADGVLHFQWRQAAAGAEKFHAAMLPHGGPDTRIHREVQALGAELAALSQGAAFGAEVPARVAIVWDWESWWALSQEAVPASTDYPEVVLAWHASLLRRGVVSDFVRPGAELAAYDLVIVPAQQLADRSEIDLLGTYADAGGQLVIGCQTAVLDRDLHAHLGGYLGGAGSALQRALGVKVEEFAPLPGADATVTVVGEFEGPAVQWQEFTTVDDAEVLARFSTGLAAGQPAVTRRATGHDGAAWYVATVPQPQLADAVIARLLVDADIDAPFPEAVDGVETTVRGGIRFVINQTAAQRRLVVAGHPVDLGPFGVVTI